MEYNSNSTKRFETSEKKNYGWTDEQINFLKANYLTLSYYQIAELIGKKPTAVSVYAMRIGLKKPDSGNGGQFKQNHAYTPSVSNNTIRVVKKGNTKITRIKIDGKWVSYSRHVWEQHNGKIPRGMHIYFKDGNQENCKIENLFLSTPDEIIHKARPVVVSIEPDIATQPEVVEVFDQEPTPSTPNDGAELIEAFDDNIIEQVHKEKETVVNKVSQVYKEMMEKGLVPVRMDDKTVRFVNPSKNKKQEAPQAPQPKKSPKYSDTNIDKWEEEEYFIKEASVFESDYFQEESDF